MFRIFKKFVYSFNCKDFRIFSIPFFLSIHGKIWSVWLAFYFIVCILIPCTSEAKFFPPRQIVNEPEHCLSMFLNDGLYNFEGGFIFKFDGGVTNIQQSFLCEKSLSEIIGGFIELLPFISPERKAMTKQKTEQSRYDRENRMRDDCLDQFLKDFNHGLDILFYVLLIPSIVIFLKWLWYEFNF